MKKASLLAVTVILGMMIGTMYIQPKAMTTTTLPEKVMSNRDYALSGFDSENITVTLLTPANQSRLVGVVNITLNITSTNGPLNLTLYINGEVYSDYNQTLITPGVQNITIDTTLLPEGNLNFTFYFENRTFTPPDKETYHLVFLVDNHGPPHVTIVAPKADDVFTGLDNLTLNITADYPEVILNISVNGEITPEWNGTLVPVGLANYTINGSRYDNGENLIEVTVWTEEGLSHSTSQTVTFLDYVRFTVRDLSHYSEIAGLYNFSIKVFTPFDTVFLSIFVDKQLAPDVQNVTLHEGDNIVPMDTTWLYEGDHNFTFIAYDSFGHKWISRLILAVNNHGPPSVSFVSPTQEILFGVVQFEIKIETTWDYVNLTVYVDDEVVENYVNKTVAAGRINFTIDVSAYSKWQHSVKVVVITEEGLRAEVKRDYGFASIKLEELASGILLLGIAFLIPLRRIKNKQSVKPFVIMNALFFLVVFALFLVLGVTSLELFVWHLNLASIWAVGTALVFSNWALHIMLLEEE